MSDLFSFTPDFYEKEIYNRLEETLHEYLDDSEMIDKLIPSIKKCLLADLEDRQKTYEKIKSIVENLFPAEDLELKKPLVLGWMLPEH